VEFRPRGGQSLVGLLLLGVALAGPAIPHGPGANEVRVEPLLEVDLAELNGQKAALVRVTIDPGGSSPPHRHPGTVLVFVLEGEVQSALDDGEVRTFGKGESWSEPVGAIHRVSKNASQSEPASLLAVLIHGDGEDLELPAE
jgi:quercetin dioxygenase-like cupin family protein